jgi:hypothetical protein
VERRRCRPDRDRDTPRLQHLGATTTTGIPGHGDGGRCRDLYGGDATTDATIAASTARIKRRIYTTTRNGVYEYSPTDLLDVKESGGTWEPPERVSLWPPEPKDKRLPGVLPADDGTEGLVDAGMGLPSNTPTPPPNIDCGTKSASQCWFDVLQNDFKACKGSNLPSGCTATSGSNPALTRMQAARREARNISIAFMAGAAPVSSVDGLGLARGNAGEGLLFKAREWVLADSELATVAVVTPPSLTDPEATPYVNEYKLYRSGVGDSSRTDSDAQIGWASA